jgi:PAS domain S-box-containing protein
MTLIGRLLAFILIAVLPAFAVLAYDQDGANLRRDIAAALVLGAMLGLLTAWLSRRHFVREPLQRLIGFADDLREGRYPPRGTLEVGTTEFAPLAKALEDTGAALAAREAALRDSQLTLRSFHENAPTLMGVVELADGDVLHVYDNPATCRFFGRKPGSTEGRLASELGAGPEAIRQWSERYREAEVRGGPVRFEYRHLVEDGAAYWLMVTVAPIGPGPSGRLRFSYVAEDITERNRAEETVRESLSRTTEILESIGDAFYALDRDWRFVYANRRALELWGKREDEVLGRPFLKTFPEAAGSETYTAHVEVMAERRPTRVEVLSPVLHRWIAASIYPAAGGGLSVYFRDVTEQKRNEERMRLLAAEVDHRAKNMLALVQIMLRHTRAANVEEFARAVQGRVAALARAHTLLSESRWHGADLLRLLEDELAPFRRAEGGRVRLDGPPVELTPRAAQSLALALHELTTNAAKHGALSAPEGRIGVGWSWRDDGRLALRWKETGGPRTDAPAERGLGTRVIARSIEDQLGGEARFDWRPEGLVFELMVPAGELTRSDRPVEV